MKTTKIIAAVSNAINTNKIDMTQLPFFKMAIFPILLVIISISLSTPANAEATGTATQETKESQPVSKPNDGKGILPTFAQADINKDHYITKDELQNFPYLLQVFDKVDAGKDGKLEDHEYQNLLLETKREGEVR